MASDINKLGVKAKWDELTDRLTRMYFRHSQSLRPQRFHSILRHLWQMARWTQNLSR